MQIMVSREEDEQVKVLEMPIEEMDLSVRSYNCLKRANINTVDDLIKKSKGDMLKVRNLGLKSLDFSQIDCIHDKFHSFYQYPLASQYSSQIESLNISLLLN